MTYVDKHIVETYSGLLEGLSRESKKAIIENLSKSLKEDKKDKEAKLFGSFGAFGSDKPAEEIIADIRESRKFRKKDLRL